MIGGDVLLEIPRNHLDMSELCVALSQDVTKFGNIEVSIFILDISAIIHQLPCCYVVRTSIIGLYLRSNTLI